MDVKKDAIGLDKALSTLACHLVNEFVCLPLHGVCRAYHCAHDSHLSGAFASGQQ